MAATLRKLATGELSLEDTLEGGRPELKRAPSGPQSLAAPRNALLPLKPQQPLSPEEAAQQERDNSRVAAQLRSLVLDVRNAQALAPGVVCAINIHAAGLEEKEEHQQQQARQQQRQQQQQRAFLASVREFFGL